MKRVVDRIGKGIRRRAPHGARGLKLPSMRVVVKSYGRAPHGARGLKPASCEMCREQSCRAPHGARGLKRIGRSSDEP